MIFDPKRLDITVRQGARTQEHLYYEAHCQAGTVIRGRYRPENQYAKGVAKNADGDGRLPKRSGRISWRAGTGEGDKKKGRSGGPPPAPTTRKGTT